MADTTSNYNLRFPQDPDIADIAQHIENLAEDVDAQLLLKYDNTGGTLTGNITISKVTPTITLNGSSGENRILRFQTGGTNRWIIQANSSGESTGNAGSNFVIQRISDAGAVLDAPFSITRSTGAVALTGDLTISKASPLVSIVGSDAAGATSLYIRGPKDTLRSLRFRTDNTARWGIFCGGETETGVNNAGSDFSITAYSDAGATLSSLTINRSTGKTTFGSVGATAGLELGTSGPRVMSGTGSPESTVTAPVGSIWYQTDSTVGVTHWRKATGTGNTGWVVMAGDTGWRKIVVSDTAVFTNTTYNAANPNSYLYLRRVGNTVEFRFNTGTSATFTTNYQTIFTLPSGFRPLPFSSPQNGTTGPWCALWDGSSIAPSTKGLYQTSNTNSTYLSAGSWTSGIGYSGFATLSTTDAWPASLPGSAA